MPPTDGLKIVLCSQQQQNYNIKFIPSLILMFLEHDDPLSFILSQKGTKDCQKFPSKNIKIDARKLPPNFFTTKKPKRLHSVSQKVSQPFHHNQFIDYQQTLDLNQFRQGPIKALRGSCKDKYFGKRESSISNRKISSQRTTTELKEDNFEGFNCTFAPQKNSSSYSQFCSQRQTNTPYPNLNLKKFFFQSC